MKRPAIAGANLLRVQGCAVVAVLRPGGILCGVPAG
jgi:hypothetical protein